MYLTNPVGSSVALNSSVPPATAGSSLTYSFSPDLEPSLYPPILTAGRFSGLVMSSLPRNSLVKLLVS